MSTGETKPRFKLWLLAFALSLALTWYVINPVPAPIHLYKTDGHTPDADGRRAQAQSGGMSHRIGVRSGHQPIAAPSSAAANEDLPEWPEYLELD